MLKKEDLTHVQTNLVISLIPDDTGTMRVANATAHHIYKDANVSIPSYMQMQAPSLAHQSEIDLSNKLTKALEDIDWGQESDSGKDGAVDEIANKGDKRGRGDKRQLKEKKSK